MPQLVTLVVTLLILLTGCESPREESAPPEKLAQQTSAAQLFQQPIAAQSFEFPTEALGHWRNHAEQRPALVIFGFDPLLHDFPPQLNEPINQLISTGTTKQFRQHGSFYRHQPLLLPPQTVRAALFAKLFSAVYWVFPSRQPATELELGDFNSQLASVKILRETERQEFVQDDGQFSTTVDGIPFHAVHPDRLPHIENPLVLHVDLGYFANSYVDEVKTPIYDLLIKTAADLRRTGWRPLSVTLSSSTGEGLVSNDFRFLIANLKTLLAQPELLDTAPPKTWQLRASALYKTAMYQSEKAQQDYQQLAALAPDQPASHYDLFRTGNRHADKQTLLGHLDRAVTLDPGYSWTYIELAADELKAKQLANAIELLQKALAADPNNSITRVELTKRLLEAGRATEAGPHLEKLRNFEWSPIYHPDFPMLIEQLDQQYSASTTGQEE